MTREERLEEMLLAIRDRLDVGPMSIGPCKLFSIAITHVVKNGARWQQCGDIFEGNCIEVVPDEPVVKAQLLEMIRGKPETLTCADNNDFLRFAKEASRRGW